MVDTRDLKRVEQVGHEIIEAGADFRVFRIEHMAFSQHRLALGGGELPVLGELLLERLHRGLALGALLEALHVDRVDLDDTARSSKRLQMRVIDVAGVIEHRLAARVRQDQRGSGEAQCIIERAVRAVRQIRDDAEAVHFGKELDAERAEAIPFRLVGRAVGELVGAEMRKT